MSYSLTYTVTAATNLEAMTNAIAMLRTGVKLRSVTSVIRVSGTLWRVVLNLWEDV